MALTPSHKSHFLQIVMFVSLILQSDETEALAKDFPEPGFLRVWQPVQSTCSHLPSSHGGDNIYVRMGYQYCRESTPFLSPHH